MTPAKHIGQSNVFAAGGLKSWLQCPNSGQRSQLGTGLILYTKPRRSLYIKAYFEEDHRSPWGCNIEFPNLKYFSAIDSYSSHSSPETIQASNLFELNIGRNHLNAFISALPALCRLTVTMGMVYRPPTAHILTYSMYV
ncbi:hypothetical protein K439DRAFT_1159409 [Ramaria rubella]|nr:hypothetical protein K439DRAFT_1159409 [Ramaria rubella]